MILYKDLFLLYNDEDCISYSSNVATYDGSVDTEFTFFNDFEEVQDALGMVRVDDVTFPQPMVIHGIMTPASIIPEIQIEKSMDVWLVHIITEMQSQRFNTIYSGIVHLTNIEHLEQLASEYLKSYTDSVFIIYGEEVPVIHTIDEEFLSDQVTEVCEIISAKAKALTVGGTE